MNNSIHNHINNLLSSKKTKVDEWIRNEYESSSSEPLFFASVDIRDSGSKVAPIDTNVFPAGFNNILQEDFSEISRIANEFLDRQNAGTKILLIPEDHTRNQFYIENVKSLKRILEGCNREVEVSTIGDLSRDKDRIITTTSFDPDVIILNNDFSRGMPKILHGLDQKILPSLEYGWHSRTKSHHFSKYEKLLEKFCLEFHMDKFFLSARFFRCGEVDFQSSKGIDCIANYVDKMMHILKKEYKEYKISYDPYLFIKADSGTYGMGIMTARSGEEVYSMNRKLRKKMHMIKDGMVNERVIIQEGIETILQHAGKSAEPMIYMLDGQPIQNLMRVNSSQNSFDSLNRSGAEFINLKGTKENVHVESYGLVSRLAFLAAAQENSTSKEK